MGLKVTIEEAVRIGDGVWKAALDPEETTAFGECKSKIGPLASFFWNLKFTLMKKLNALLLIQNQHS